MQRADGAHAASHLHVDAATAHAQMLGHIQPHMDQFGVPGPVGGPVGGTVGGGVQASVNSGIQGVVPVPTSQGHDHHSHPHPPPPPHSLAPQLTGQFPGLSVLHTSQHPDPSLTDQSGSVAAPGTSADRLGPTGHPHDSSGSADAVGPVGSGSMVPGSAGPPGTGSRVYECEYCGWQFSLKGNLAAHMRRHTGEKPFQCHVCQRKFTQSSLLTVHMRTHTGERPFQCQVCGREFSRSGNLSTHLRIHNQVKPFSCSFCGKQFSQRVNMELHSRVHTGVKPYKCGVCSRQFTSCSNMRRHWRQVHPAHPEPALGTTHLTDGMPEKAFYENAAGPTMVNQTQFGTQFMQAAAVAAAAAAAATPATTGPGQSPGTNDQNPVQMHASRPTDQHPSAGNPVPMGGSVKDETAAAVATASDAMHSMQAGISRSGGIALDARFDPSIREHRGA